jgi:hypothetical protein
MLTQIDEQKHNDSLREKWNEDEKKRGYLENWRNDITFKTYSIDGVKYTVGREEE